MPEQESDPHPMAPEAGAERSAQGRSVVGGVVTALFRQMKAPRQGQGDGHEPEARRGREPVVKSGQPPAGTNGGHDAAELRSEAMATTTFNLSALNDLTGFIGACLVDSDTGLMLGQEGGANIDLEAAGAANTEIVKAKLAAMSALGLDDKIEDILISLGKQYHLIRPLEANPSVFLYVCLDRKAANLGMARIHVKNVEKTISF